ncbi:MAG: methylated-DNA-[protein]-cysteine S-methyltransferase [Patiriisocius sp.]
MLMNTCHIKTPLGILELNGDETGLVSVLFCDTPLDSAESIKETQTEIAKDNIPLALQQAVNQLEEYFEGSRKIFDLTLLPMGTQFQKKVWQQLTTIPFGKTVSYQKMANNLGDPKVIRAAAIANGKNPISIIIPCHRVIGTDGSLTGYASGLHRKKWLLEHESPVTQGVLF